MTTTGSIILPRCGAFVCGSLVAALLAACGAPSDESVRGLAVTVTPLTLPGVGEAVYTLRVLSRDGLVWEGEHLSSDRYGDGVGALSYVAPCDAGANPHTVELVLEDLRSTDGASLAGSYVNPAPVGAPLRVPDIVCRENADTPVVINLAIMRDARQGFFDVAVNFEDIFCSAKLDCLDADEQPIELLFNAEGARDTTVVIGFACTAGRTREGQPESTWLHMTEVTLACEGVPEIHFAPNGGLGNGPPLGPGPQLFATGTYRGQESLPGWDKCYWNLALGLDLANARDCRVRFQATASHASFVPNDLASPPQTLWPYIDFDVPLTDNGALACTHHPLNGTPAGVGTDYTTFAGAHFRYEWECGPAEDIVDDAIACAGSYADGTRASVTATPVDVTVTMGGVRSPVTYTLPSGYYVGSEAACCTMPCCAE